MAKKQRMLVGIDPGHVLGSVVYVSMEDYSLLDYKLVKPTSKHSNPIIRAQCAARDFVNATYGGMPPHDVHRIVIEEPIYSWQRRNPKVFAAGTLLMGFLWERLNKKYSYAREGVVVTVNNRTAKALAAKNLGISMRKPPDKAMMVRAFERETGLRMRVAKKAKETIADAYFIAMTGLK